MCKLISFRLDMHNGKIPSVFQLIFFDNKVGYWNFGVIINMYAKNLTMSII